jgi:hypothetical protein
MKKQNVLTKTALAIAVSASFVPAYVSAVGLFNTGAVQTFARQTLGTGVNITLNNVSYTTQLGSTPFTVNPNGCVDFYFRLTNATWNLAANGDYIAVGTANETLQNGMANPLFAARRSTDNSTLLLRYRNTAGAPVAIGTGGTVSLNTSNSNSAAVNVLAPNVAALAAGGAVTIEGLLTNPGLSSADCATVFPTVPASGAALNSVVNAANGVAALETGGPANLALSANGAVVTVHNAGVASGPFTAAENKRIDVTVAVNSGTLFTPGTSPLTTGATLVALGAVRVNAVANVNLANGTAMNIQNFLGNVSIALTAANGSFQVGSNLYVSNAPSCAFANAISANVAVTAGTVNGPTLTVSGTNASAAGNSNATQFNGYICYAVLGGSNQIPTLNSNASGSALTTIAGASNIAAVSGGMFPLVQNGQTIDITSYVPTQFASSGYTSYIRVVNSGAIAGTVRAAYVDSEGNVSASVPLRNIPAGGAYTFTAADIETTLGLFTTGSGATFIGTEELPASANTTVQGTGGPGNGAKSNRPRIRLTAPWSGMRAVSFLFQPGGTFVILGKEYDSAGGALTQ